MDGIAFFVENVANGLVLRIAFMKAEDQLEYAMGRKEPARLEPEFHGSFDTVAKRIAEILEERTPQ